MRLDYDDAVSYLEDEKGISCDPCNAAGEYACDLLDDYCEYDRDDEPYYTKTILNQIAKDVKAYIKENENSLEDDEDDEEE